MNRLSNSRGKIEDQRLFKQPISNNSCVRNLKDGKGIVPIWELGTSIWFIWSK
jgi:hypothetical protein